MIGKIYVVGIGPGNNDLLTLRAKDALIKADVIVGYKVYIDLIEKIISQKKCIHSQMTKEIDRCKMAINKAEEGNIVALVSSGDAGIYGMAGPLLEIADEQKSKISIEVVPAVSAFNGAAARLGAPIMHDHCSISLSDRLTPWEIIEKRLHLAAEGDFVVSLYNPKSKGRPHYISDTTNIFLKYRDANTVVGIVKNAEREGEKIVITTLVNMLNHDIDMFTIVIIGNQSTKNIDSKMITPRGYKI